MDDYDYDYEDEEVMEPCWNCPLDCPRMCDCDVCEVEEEWEDEEE